MERNAISPPDVMQVGVIQVGDGLELRPITADHAADLYTLALANRERLRKWFPWFGPDYSPAQMRQHAVDREADNARGTSLTMTIWLDGRLCGVIGLHQIDFNNRRSSIGYWLAAEAEGRGVMTRACKALIDIAFSRYGLHRIEIRCATGNLRSKAIPRRLGFTEEGLLRQAEWIHDHWVDLRVFSMLRSEWSPG